MVEWEADNLIISVLKSYLTSKVRNHEEAVYIWYLSILDFAEKTDQGLVTSLVNS